LTASSVKVPTRPKKADKAKAEEPVLLGEKELTKQIKRLEKEMVEHAKNLEFEKAARVRDQLALLKQQLFGSAGQTNVVAIDTKKSA